MDFNHFIIGEKYNISALAIEGSFAEKKYAVFKLPTGRTFLLRAEDFEAVSSADDIKNTETTPKYDPNRLFRKGDKVEVVKNKGRLGSSTLPVGTRATVARDEEECDWVFLKADDCDKIDTVDAAYLKLVTPVEELAPYFVGESENSYDLFRKTGNGNQLRASFWWKHNPTPELLELSKANAKAAAEAERDRLNAEYRKEQEC